MFLTFHLLWRGRCEEVDSKSEVTARGSGVNRRADIQVKTRTTGDPEQNRDKRPAPRIQSSYCHYSDLAPLLRSTTCLSPFFSHPPRRKTGVSRGSMPAFLRRCWGLQCSSAQPPQVLSTARVCERPRLLTSNVDACLKVPISVLKVLISGLKVPIQNPSPALPIVTGAAARVRKWSASSEHQANGFVSTWITLLRRPGRDLKTTFPPPTFFLQRGKAPPTPVLLR